MSAEAKPDDLPIVEGVMTTLNEDGSANIAPMGPRVDREFTQFTLRPFQTSTTFRNLKCTGQGVFHVVDDVELVARAAIDQWEKVPAMRRAMRVEGMILEDACRWFELRVEHWDDRQERTTIRMRVESSGVGRPFFGFNRAKHAVLEAAILATRIGILPDETIRQEVTRLAVPVEKTAGDQERQAFALLQDYIDHRLSSAGR